MLLQFVSVLVEVWFDFGSALELNFVQFESSVCFSCGSFLSQFWFNVASILVPFASIWCRVGSVLVQFGSIVVHV